MKNKLSSVVIGFLLWLVASAQPVVAAGTYGPIAAQETLWSIASRLRPTYAVSTQQVVLAIRAKNPQSFTAANINALKKGTVLKLPSLAEIQQRDRIQALHTARQQNRHWQSGNKLASTKTRPQARPARVNTVARKTALANARQTQTRLKQEITNLRTQLKHEQQRSGQLTSQIQALQTSGKNPVTTNTEVGKLRAEVAELKSVLEEKNTHIQNLQASLKEASEAIKQQYADNQLLQEKLRATLPPGLVPETPNPADGKPQLTLSGVGNTAAAPNNADGKPPVFADQLTNQGNNPSPQNPVALKNLLAQQAAAPTQALTPPNQSSITEDDKKAYTPSRLSLAIALISALFILALLWRTFNQGRELQTEQDIRRRAANDPITEPKPDMPKEPHIAF
jgi:FimV-like protein